MEIYGNFKLSWSEPGSVAIVTDPDTDLDPYPLHIGKSVY
jgi:hypothetical protein